MNTRSKQNLPILGPVSGKTSTTPDTCVFPQYYIYNGIYYYPDQYYNYYDPYGNQFAYDDVCTYRRYDPYGRLVSCSNIP